MKKITTIIILQFLVIHLMGQEIIKDQNGELTTSISSFKNGKINGKIQVSDIFYPDESFNCMKPLGEPIKIEENHTTAGDDYEFFYDGVTLFFSNVMTGDKVKLSSIEFIKNSHFLELSGSKDRITTSKSLNKMIPNSNINQFDLAGGEKTIIRFFDDEGSRIEFDKENGTITKIKIYFL